MIFRVLILPFIFLCTATPLIAQSLDASTNQDSLSIWSLLKHDSKYTVKSVAHSLSRPVQWKGDDFGKLGILIAGTATLSLIDEPIRDFSQNNREDFPKILRDFGWYFGSPQNYFMANAGLYTFGLLTKNEKVRKTSVLIISSSITTGLIQSISKSAIGRARPGSGFDNYTFNPFSGEATYRSFPSGHTVLSITMAHAVAKQFENPWVKAGIYTVGAIPPISRLIDDAHWLTDITFSAALSIIVVDCIDNYLNAEKAYEYPKKKKQISWNLRFSPNQIGIVGTF
ncbi:phosphatase PAP2 family protein [Psychroserpens sp. SPM9]|uniref:phosphatase PAP2 family protein n=1 Tax=Psychroserpens sp. SPM9 TaxID=2975598 RepID=UPI0021A8D653|nr:phosphatase PAP2 family protein [Psychroserpens sp. SPM9]MDG5491233.1 phosphatase PAP2 family protein [Psychroserpens sp. SPM9]